jgi:hypothetical protein
MATMATRHLIWVTEGEMKFRDITDLMEVAGHYEGQTYIDGLDLVVTVYAPAPEGPWYSLKAWQKRQGGTHGEVDTQA